MYNEKTEKITGVYEIINTETGEKYIGRSVDVETRIKAHFKRAFNPKNKEYNMALYQAMRKYPISVFEWKILEQCSEDELDDREKYWIEKENSFINGYNSTPGGIGVIEVNKDEGHPNHSLTKAQVIDIRTRYNNKERKKVVYQDYKDIISESGFHKVWNGETWSDVMPEVFTPENIYFHTHNTGQKGTENAKAKIAEEDVKYIRKQRKKGKTIRDVYKEYDDKLTFGSFRLVWYGQNWKHITI